MEIGETPISPTDLTLLSKENKDELKSNAQITYNGIAMGGGK